MLLTGFNWAYHFRLNTSQSVLIQGSIEGRWIPGEARSLQLLNIIPSCLSVVYLSSCWILLKNAYGNLNEVWPLSGLSCGSLDEEEHFIYCVLISQAHGIGQCLLLAILMTSKFDMRPLAKASWLVAPCLSPERLTTASHCFD